MTKETIQGAPVTDDQIEQWAAEAEQGYPPEVLRKRGRKPVGDGPGTVVPVRMDETLLAAISELAAKHHVSRSEAIREAVRRAVATS